MANTLTWHFCKRLWLDTLPWQFCSTFTWLTLLEDTFKWKKGELAINLEIDVQIPSFSSRPGPIKVLTSLTDLLYSWLYFPKGRGRMFLRYGECIMMSWCLQNKLEQKWSYRLLPHAHRNPPGLHRNRDERCPERHLSASQSLVKEFCSLVLVKGCWPKIPETPLNWMFSFGPLPVVFVWSFVCLSVRAEALSAVAAQAWSARQILCWSHEALIPNSRW